MTLRTPNCPASPTLSDSSDRVAYQSGYTDSPLYNENSIMVNMVNDTRTLIAMSESHISECTIRPLLEVWRIVLL